MQVRGGDKYLEYDKLVEADAFIEKVETLGLSHMPLFIFTDDYRNVTYLREKRPEWKLMTLTGEDERGYYNNEFNKQDWEFRKANLIKLLAIIEVCVKADLHIGSNQSCVDMYLRSRKGETELYCVVVQCTDNGGGIAADYRVGGNVLCDDAPGCDNGALADGNAL